MPPVKPGLDAPTPQGTAPSSIQQSNVTQPPHGPARPTQSLVPLASQVHQRLDQGLSVRRTLPGGGRIHIDRPLPFLVLYRRPVKRNDSGMEDLAKSEASYLYISADPTFRRGTAALLRSVASVLQRSFGRFLLLELFSRPPTHRTVVADAAPHSVPAFRIFTPRGASEFYPLVECLEQHLSRIKLLGRDAAVEAVSSPGDYPDRIRPAFAPKEARELGCVQIGIEVEPVFRAAADEAVFPTVLRSLRTSFDRSLRRLFYIFAEQFTSHRPKNFHALGRRAMVKAVWQVDAALDRIARSFDFLLHVTPINSQQAWQEFRRSGFELCPRLHYRPLPIDPSLTKRALFSVPIERVEDPTLAQLFLEKQAELDRQVTMLAERGTRHFLFGSIQLYGWIDDELLRAAESVLERVPNGRGHTQRSLIKADQFKRLVLTEIDHYRRQWSGFEGTAEIDDGVASLIVSRGKLLIPRHFQVTAARADALLQHEVGTHLVTYYNGCAHRFTQLRSGLAGYEELQEGLATLTEYLALGMSASRLRTLAARVCASQMLIDQASFVDAFRLLCRYGFAQKQAFDITLRVFRSGGLTKDVIYFRGLRGLLNYLREEDQLLPLFVGKIAIKHIPIVKELQTRGVLEPPRVHPRILARPSTAERLRQLQLGIQLHELVD